MTKVQPEDRKWRATTSLVLGIIALLGAFAASPVNILAVLFWCLMAIIFGLSAVNKTSRKRSANAGIILGIVAIVVGLLMAFIPSMYSDIEHRAASSSDVESALKQKANELNADLPRKMSETVTANRVSAEGNTITYDLTLSADVDESQLSNASLKDPMVGPLCNDENSRVILDEGVTFTYVYTHAASQNKYNVAITSYDC